LNFGRSSGGGAETPARVSPSLSSNTMTREMTRPYGRPELRRGTYELCPHADADEVSGRGVRRGHANHDVVEHVHILARDPVMNQQLVCGAVSNFAR
jgi:hypothetical protein